MYTIYINDRPLTLRSTPEPGTSGSAPAPTHLVARYNGKRRTLLNYVDMLEKGSPKVTSVDLVADDVEVLWDDYRSHYKWVPAAGGLVRNTSSGRYLFIYRRGSWDLPKGKLDEGEDEPTAALREVEEETGVTDLRLGRRLATSLHTYRTGKGKRVLKPTYWFRMDTTQTVLTPEEGEGIELAQWRSLEEMLHPGVELYASLRWLLRRAR